MRHRTSFESRQRQRVAASEKEQEFRAHSSEHAWESVPLDEWQASFRRVSRCKVCGLEADNHDMRERPYSITYTRAGSFSIGYVCPPCPGPEREA